MNIFHALEKKKVKASTAPILGFLFGTLLSISVSSIFKGLISYPIIYTGLISVLVISAILFFQYLYVDVKSYFDNYARLKIISLSESETKKHFIDLRELVLDAKKSITVLSASLPDIEKVDLPPERNTYLSGIEELIEEKLNNQHSEKFRYKRILLSTSKNLSPTLEKDQIDLPMYLHCKKISTIVGKTGSTNVIFDLTIRPPIFSCPTILIIDNKYVTLGVLSEFGKKIDMRGSITIEDASGKTAEHYKHLVDQLTIAEDSKKITSFAD